MGLVEPLNWLSWVVSGMLLVLLKSRWGRTCTGSRHLVQRGRCAAFYFSFSGQEAGRVVLDLLALAGLRKEARKLEYDGPQPQSQAKKET